MSTAQHYVIIPTAGFLYHFSTCTLVFKCYKYFPNISSQIQDPLVLLDPVCLGETLLEWLPVLERVLGPAELGSSAVSGSNTDGAGQERWERDYLNSEESGCSSGEAPDCVTEEKNEESPEVGERENQCDSTEKVSEAPYLSEPVRVVSPKPVPPELLVNLTQLATLYTELSCFRNQENERAPGCTAFLRSYFFLLDQERIRRMCLLCYQERPEVQSSFTEAMLGQNLLLTTLLSFHDTDFLLIQVLIILALELSKNFELH